MARAHATIPASIMEELYDTEACLGHAISAMMANSNPSMMDFKVLQSYTTMYRNYLQELALSADESEASWERVTAHSKNA